MPATRIPRQPAEEYEISDLICDLLHHGDRCGFHHQTILDRALMHYTAEVADEAERRNATETGRGA